MDKKFLQRRNIRINMLYFDIYLLFIQLEVFSNLNFDWVFNFEIDTLLVSESAASFTEVRSKLHNWIFTFEAFIDYSLRNSKRN